MNVRPSCFAFSSAKLVLPKNRRSMRDLCAYTSSPLGVPQVSQFDLEEPPVWEVASTLVGVSKFVTRAVNCLKIGEMPRRASLGDGFDGPSSSGELGGLREPALRVVFPVGEVGILAPKRGPSAEVRIG